MNRFRQIAVDRFSGNFHNAHYLPEIMFLYSRWKKFLDDDYAANDESFFEYFMKLVERVSPFFWVIVEGESVTGFIYLEKIIGNTKNLHSAEVITCFDKAFWGDYTKETGKLFLNLCFKGLEFKKIKAQIYPENSRVKTLLKKIGFEKEGLLRAETLKHGKLQDIELYSILSKNLDEI